MAAPPPYTNSSACPQSTPEPGAVPSNSPSSSRSPSRGPIGRTLSLIGAKLANTLSSTPENGKGHPPSAYHRAGLEHRQGKTFADDESTLCEQKERSVSRGRESLVSSGRGGLGNIRPASVSRDARQKDGPEDYSDSRGREPRQEHAEVFSTGRGGAGNMRSPSREAPVMRSGASTKDQEMIRSHIVADQEAGVHSTGRGGVGNIRGGSRSRSRARDSIVGSGTHTPVHSTGRGGVGNIFHGPVPHEDESEIQVVKSHLPHDDTHSTGRGGTANISHAHPPAVEHSHHEHHHGDYESTGRGGAGNIIRE